MAGIESVRNDIQAARARRSGHADGRDAVTRSEAIAIVQRAVAAGVAADDIRQAFHQAGDNGFGVPMARYLNEFDVLRLIGSEPPPSLPLPQPPVLDIRAQRSTSSYGELEVTPEVGADTNTVTTHLKSPNPFAYSSGPGETPLVHGRDGLFDQTLLRLYGYAPSDPLSPDDRARATTLMRDRDLARARHEFITAGPQAGAETIAVTLPRMPEVAG